MITRSVTVGYMLSSRPPGACETQSEDCFGF